MKSFFKKRNSASNWRIALVENALDGIVAMDSRGRILEFNPAAENLFGYRRMEVIGCRVSDKLIPPSHQKSHESGLARLLAAGHKQMPGRRMTVTARRADQSIFPVELSIISVNSRKSPVFIACLRKAADEKPAEPEDPQYGINIKKTLMQSILAVSRIVEIRDPYTAGHQRRVAHLAANMARVLNFLEERIDGVYLGALIHDIGKIAVPHEILARPGKLLDEDINYLKIHCRKGYEILEPVNFPWPVAEIALQHHEHIDGSGYPQGLKNDEILLEARIIGVADVVESLTAHRPYRPAYSLEQALSQIRGKAGTWYDREIVTACTDLFENGYRIDAVDMDELTWKSSL
ncbi:MAG: HD domain-containing phosphohydrolase [Desulfobacterales bacterium]